jgi:hypothetical protein
MESHTLPPINHRDATAISSIPNDNAARGARLIEAVREALNGNQMVVTEMSLECDPPLMALAMYLAAGTIDWAAHETSKSREEILQEIERNFKSMIVPADAGPDETSPGRVATEDDT